MVTVICTKCGTSNQVQFGGYRYSTRCISCNKIMQIGGKERGLKSLPLHQIAIILGLVFVVAAVVAVLQYRVDEGDPLDKHRAAIYQAAMKAVRDAAKSDWDETQLKYVQAFFNSGADLACCRVGYQFTKSSLSYSLWFPMKFALVESVTGRGPIIWEPKAIGVQDPDRIAKLERERLAAREAASRPAETRYGRAPAYGEESKKEEAGDDYTDECDALDEGWLRYRWLDFDSYAHKPIIQGEAGTEFLREAKE